MEDYKIRICSDPYRKNIDYFWLEDNGKWSYMNEMDNSPFNEGGFVSTSVSHKAYDIYKVITEKFLKNKTMGVKIIFEGTDDDFADMCSIKDMYFSEYDIELERGRRKMKIAKEVMPQIENSFDKLYSFFQEYPDKEIEAIIGKFTDAVKPEIAICVMGLYSSGKSAFINSLIGQEILPSASDPATAKIYKIRENKKHMILFNYQNEDYCIEFSGAKWKPNKNPNSDILRLVTKYINENSANTEEQFMYWTLYALNEYAKEEGKKRHDDLIRCAEKLLRTADVISAKNDEEKIEKLLSKYRIKELVERKELPENKLDDVIEVNVSFVHSYLPLDKFKFVIYDTPGSNSVMFREHADILKDSLEQQTNGLPILVTNPDSMDQTDNEDIIKIIDELGGALDASSLMLVVNKSDEKSREDLQKKVDNRENLVLTKWKANRVYFVSSIIGLGGKKVYPEDRKSWIDATYHRTFRHNKVDFEDYGSEFYLRLFEYNMLPHDSKERLAERVRTLGQEELLLWNSGIPCVEEEIGVFAEKYALYNICSQAIQYLSDACLMVAEEVETAELAAKEQRESIQISLDVEKKGLIKKLQEECDRKKTQFTSNFVSSVISGSIRDYVDETRIEKIVNDAYKTSAGKNDFEKLKQYNEKIEAALRGDIKAYARETSEKTERYWSKCADELRESLMKIVVGSNALTIEQKEILKKVVLKVAMIASSHKALNITSTTAVKNKGEKFLWILWDITHISKSESKKKYKEAINSDITSNTNKVVDDNEKSFQAWVSTVITTLTTVVSSFNPVLADLSSKLEEQQKIIAVKSEQGGIISNELEAIEMLLEFEEE